MNRRRKLTQAEIERGRGLYEAYLEMQGDPDAPMIEDVLEQWGWSRTSLYMLIANDWQMPKQPHENRRMLAERLGKLEKRVAELERKLRQQSS